MALSAGTRLDPYEIVGALGAGGMGEVYRARDAKLNRDVALKVLPEDAISRVKDATSASGNAAHRACWPLGLSQLPVLPPRPRPLTS